MKALIVILIGLSVLVPTAGVAGYLLGSTRAGRVADRPRRLCDACRHAPASLLASSGDLSWYVCDRCGLVWSGELAVIPADVRDGVTR